MSDEQRKADDRRWAEHCRPAFDSLHQEHIALVTRLDNRLDKHDERLREIEVITKNGYDVRLKAVERMQWWQLGILITIFGLIITLHVMGA